MAPKAVSPSKAGMKNHTGSHFDSARRRRSPSIDEHVGSAPPSPDKRPRSPRMNVFPQRKRKTKSSAARMIVTLLFDVAVLVYLFRSMRGFIWPGSSNGIDGPGHGLQTDPPRDNVPPALSLFEKILPETLSCEPMDEDGVTYTLVLQLSDNRLWTMQHHCELWGSLAPISAAIWTSLREEEILDKLQLMGCDLDHLTLQTLSSENHSLVDYPINKLRNMALRAATTSHVFILDIDFFESVDLFDTLNSPRVRRSLASDPKLAMVVPSFEIQGLDCGTTSKCHERHLHWMPRDFEDLVISLGANKALPYDPTNFARQGSTKYREWMRQNHAELVDITCVSSNQYQPFVVVRLCNSLPPFQEAFMGYGRNSMAWMMHLRRSGYRLQQVGGSFVVHYPHVDSRAKTEWEKHYQSNSISSSLRGRIDDIFTNFKKWLVENVADESRLDKCEDFDDDDGDLRTRGHSDTI